MKEQGHPKLTKSEKHLSKPESPYHREIERVKQVMSMNPEELAAHRREKGYLYNFNPTLVRPIREGIELGYVGKRLDRYIEMRLREIRERSEESANRRRMKQWKLVGKFNEHPLNQQAKKLLISSKEWLPSDQLHVITLMWAYPIGIDATIFRNAASQATRGLAEQLSIPDSSGHRVILGVDRLDYTKGIPERLRSFGRLLEHNPSMRGKVSFVQISSPSRTRVPEYTEEKQRVDQLVGQINGRFSQGGWVPIRYLYRWFPQQELARFYRDCDVCMVTPLRDGMNLVAQEFVAAQGEDPGVLVLSEFAGAASTMDEALRVNPYDIDGTAEALYTALRMPPLERRRRWEALKDVVSKRSAQSWSESFRTDLASA